MARPKRGNYAYGDAGQARYRKAVQEYNAKMKKLREEKTKITSTKKNIEKQKTANKKAGTTKTKTTPTSTAAKGKTLATGKRTGMTKAEKQKMLEGNSFQDKEKATKTRTRTRTQTKSKTTPKKTVTPKKPVAKKPVAKKPAGKVPAKKPLISNKNKLRIKKAVNTAADTTKKVVKKGVEQSKKVASNVKTKVDATKNAFNKKSPTKRPTTRLQKLTSKGNKALKASGRYIKGPLKKHLIKEGKRFVRGVGKDPKSLLKGAKGAGISWAAERLTDAAMKRVGKSLTKRSRNQTFKEYDAETKKIRREADVLPTLGRTVKGIGNVLTGKKYTDNNKTYVQKRLEEKRKNQSSTTKNINKQKKNNNNKLKVNKSRGLKTQYSSNAARKKQNFNAPTGTKKVDKRFASFREDPTENRKLQDERKKNNNTTETYSRRLSDKAKKTKNTKTTSSGKKMHAIEKRNRKIFGDAHVDRLKAKHAEWKKRRKKK
jgi:hypothetical protein